MNYRKLGTFSTASDALGCYATPTAGAAYWRGKVGIVRGVSDASNRLNPLMSVEFEWEIDGSRLPRKETWPIALMSLGLVNGFASQIAKHETEQADKLIAELGTIDIGNLEVSLPASDVAFLLILIPNTSKAESARTAERKHKHDES